MSGDIANIMEKEEVEIILFRGDTGLGFNIQGGLDSPYLPEDFGVFVVKIRGNGAAAKDGRLKEGDKILAINDVRLDGMTHVEAVNQFLDAGDEVKLRIIPGAEAAIVEKREVDLISKKAQGSGLLNVLMLVTGTAIIGVGAVMAYRHYRPRSS